jgi:hypothetical protein
MIIPRGLPLSPPPSSGGELTPERVTDPNGVYVPAYLPNGMEHVKIGELGAGSSSMVTSLFSTDLVRRANSWVGLRVSSYFLLPTSRLPNSHASFNPCKY